MIYMKISSWQSQSPGNVFTCKMCSTFPKVTSETKSSTCLCWAVILALVKTLTRSLQERYKNKEGVSTVLKRRLKHIKWRCPQGDRFITFSHKDIRTMSNAQRYKGPRALTCSPIHIIQHVKHVSKTKQSQSFQNNETNTTTMTVHALHAPPFFYCICFVLFFFFCILKAI